MKKFLFKHPHILSFGAFQIFFSAPGQTFLIAQFVAPIFEEMGFSRSMFAGLYSAATLLAALFLNPSGRLIDRYPPQKIIRWITVLMAIGCWILAGAQNIAMLFFAFFILRLVGQGVFSLTASTLIVKSFEKNRGKAMGIVTLGFPISEAIYPTFAIFLLGVIGWRMSYVVFGLLNLIVMLPLQLYLLGKSNIRPGHFLSGEASINPQRLPGHPEERKFKPQKDKPLGEALHDIKFYLILASSCIPPMVVTGLFFHQKSLFDSNHWMISLAATGLVFYAIAKAVSSVTCGFIVDKFGPMKPFVGLITMLGVGTYLAAQGGPTPVIFLYYAIIGTALGFSSPVSNVIWPYFYGTKYMGSIKGFVATFRNGFTAFGPLPIAIALDAGITINTILQRTSYGIFAFAILPVIVFWLDKREKAV